ncbi:hypothetical protein L873DRAFT_687603 [Choiromyces venosus 120613-1]|uniref:Uncharacterized protein n=1 Tax=Choiromyces venosus 120613-1 TaxID=1336337 RepID=A0A3N4JS12_9PEZI|nr:hypothetical protein L873DRAFT_687603 [Choiromyces venosus 120613-1]
MIPPRILISIVRPITYRCSNSLLDLCSFDVRRPGPSGGSSVLEKNWYCKVLYIKRAVLYCTRGNGSEARFVSIRYHIHPFFSHPYHLSRPPYSNNSSTPLRSLLKEQTELIWNYRRPSTPIRNLPRNVPHLTQIIFIPPHLHQKMYKSSRTVVLNSTCTFFFFFFSELKTQPTNHDN